MSYFASVNGFQIVSGELLIPSVGAWTADLHLAGEETLSGACTVVIGNLSLAGTAFRSAAYGGQTRARLVAGAGGWRTSINAQGYGSPSGVKLSAYLGDAASAAKETINVATDRSIGPGCARLAGLASEVLWYAVQRGFIPAWYVDPSGTTQTQAWPMMAIASPFTVVDQQPDKGLAIIATEDYAAWMPGCTFTSPLVEGPFTSGGVHYVWSDDGKFRFEVLTDATDRVLGPIQAVIQKEIQHTKFLGRYSYTIHNPTTSTVDATPVDETLGLPDLTNAPLRSDSISTYTPPSGGACDIMFLDGIAPVCVWTAGAPTHANMLNGTNPSAKLGDTTQTNVGGTFTVTGGLLGGLTAPPGGGPVTGTPVGTLTMMCTAPCSGTITTGSSQLGTPN